MHNLDDMDEEGGGAASVQPALLALPTDQRRAFEQLRDMAALKGIALTPSVTDDGLIGFKLEHHAQTVRCPDLPSLKAELIAHGVPLLSDEELQRLLHAFQSAFMRQMDDAAGPHGDH